ncbi:hypothetical protein ASD15_19635 [Massilia sp. Root351]|jgi:Spy/CpxP family protein refolding chaperone|uniref:Spy/CpxP family protein refolding chaperone n=1 Tax=Massilia sp. Root351 TaxID=1736522 RepID=UPI00070997F7|nr:Spy/CpxP family protein refolding chaperone [Massilia sp. Root351]KQV79533.1 hypothetical protein ASD15_19635 [Massilia sp. Root351]
MNTIRKSLIIGMAVLSLGAVGGSAFAADTPAPGRHGQALTQEQRAARAAERQATFKEMMARHQAALHDKLKLTAAQEPAWNAFVAASAPKLPAARADRAALAQLSAPERAERRLEMHKQMIAQHETRLAALKTFYAQLTPEQQKTFDQATQRHHRRGHRPGGGHGAMHHS